LHAHLAPLYAGHGYSRLRARLIAMDTLAEIKLKCSDWHPPSICREKEESSKERQSPGKVGTAGAEIGRGWSREKALAIAPRGAQ
jgi:hypothetical protein